MKKLLPFVSITLFFLQCAFAQSGMWTWVKGPNTTNGNPVFGNQGVEAALNNPPPVQEAAIWTDTSGNFWMYAGQDSGVNWGDLWKFNPVSNNWAWVKGSGLTYPDAVFGTMGIPSINNIPSSRGNGVCTWVDHHGDLWLYGGLALQGLSSDMWRYNIASNTWTWMQGDTNVWAYESYGALNVEAVGNTPGARERSACWTDSAGNLCLYGGFDGFGLVNDFWRYNINTNLWAWIGGDSLYNENPVYGTKGVASITNTPGGQAAGMSWMDARGDIWLFEGEGRANGMWKYQPSTGLWTWMSGNVAADSLGNYGALCFSDTGFMPCRRFGSRASWTDDCGNFWLYGGRTSRGPGPYDGFDDMWFFSPTSLKWTRVMGDTSGAVHPVYGSLGTPSSSNTPGGRVGAMAWRSKSGQVYLFGGGPKDFTGIYSDLWKFSTDTSCGAQRTGNFVLQLNNSNTVCGQSIGSASIRPVYGASPYLYNWNTGSNSDSITALSSGTYTVTVTDHSGCTASITAIVDSSAVGLININTTSNTLCMGDTATICAPSGFPNYAWSSGSNTQCTYASAAGNFNVTVTDNAGCQDTSNYVEINMFAPSALPIIISGDTFSVPDERSYQWYFNNTFLPGDTSNKLIATGYGVYSVVATDSNGCMSSDSTTFTVGIKSLGNILFMQISPDPASNDLNLSYSLAEPADMQIIITDLQGKRVMDVLKETATAGGSLKHINIGPLASGPYFLNFISATDTKTLRFVKQ